MVRRSRRCNPARRTSRSGPACRSSRSGIAGTEEILRDHGSKIPHFGRVVMVVGDPIVTPPRESGGVVPRDQVEALTAQLHEALQVVFDEANERRARR